MLDFFFFSLVKDMGFIFNDISRCFGLIARFPRITSNSVLSGSLWEFFSLVFFPLQILSMLVFFHAETNTVATRRVSQCFVCRGAFFGNESVLPKEPTRVVVLTVTDLADDGNIIESSISTRTARVIFRKTLDRTEIGDGKRQSCEFGKRTENTHIQILPIGRRKPRTVTGSPAASGRTARKTKLPAASEVKSAAGTSAWSQRSRKGTKAWTARSRSFPVAEWDVFERSDVLAQVHVAFQSTQKSCTRASTHNRLTHSQKPNVEFSINTVVLCADEGEGVAVCHREAATRHQRVRPVQARVLCVEQRVAVAQQSALELGASLELVVLELGGLLWREHERVREELARRQQLRVRVPEVAARARARLQHADGQSHVPPAARAGSLVSLSKEKTDTWDPL